jgi:hypothetical protein
MSPDEQNAFVLCALVTGVDLDEYVDWKAPNPLYYIEDDDPAKLDYSEDEARVKLDELRSRFDDIFSKGLSKLPPKRPINHDIDEIVSDLSPRSCDWYVGQVQEAMDSAPSQVR